MKIPLLIGLAMASAALAADLRVDPVHGNDANDGVTQPFKTIARGIRLAQPGDTVHLAPGIYYESADLSRKHGAPGKPITLDGHGAILEGSEPVNAADWEALGNGMFRKVKLMPRMDEAIIGRWFFLWNGKMNRMNRCSKGPTDPLKAPADLLPDEWTYVEAEDAFYLKLPEGQDLDAAKIRYPARSSAVVMSLDGSHLTVRNITGTHVYNDGYNIHGAQRNLVFENIAAIECGDDGFSAHEDADCLINGFTSIGNSTGLCDTGTSVTHYKNVFIKDCVGFDLYFIGLKHSMENALIESNAVRPLWIQGTVKDGTTICEVKLKNVLVRTNGKTREMRLSERSQLEAENCTFQGVHLTMTEPSSINLIRCRLGGGDPKPNVHIWPKVVWKGTDSFYDLRSLRVYRTDYPQAKFADFQAYTGSDAGSQWADFSTAPAHTGANEASLRGLIRP